MKLHDWTHGFEPHNKTIEEASLHTMTGNVILGFLFLVIDIPIFFLFHYRIAKPTHTLYSLPALAYKLSDCIR